MSRVFFLIKEIDQIDHEQIVLFWILTEIICLNHPICGILSEHP